MKNKRPLPTNSESEWSRYSKGYKNQKADDRQAGILPTAGFDKLAIEDYPNLRMLATKSCELSDQLVAENFCLNSSESYNSIISKASWFIVLQPFYEILCFSIVCRDCVGTEMGFMKVGFMMSMEVHF